MHVDMYACMYVNPPFVIRIVEEAEVGGDRVWRQAAKPPIRLMY
jgi:hypothetical protein